MTAGPSDSPTYLSGIVSAHRECAACDERDIRELVREASDTPTPRPFAKSIASATGSGVIAEIKRRSPSRGILAPDLVPAESAASYEDGGAVCLSVLTDERFFDGSPEDLRAARAASSLPVLRKDFTVSGNDIADARLMGADAVLLIVAALSRDELCSFVDLASELGMDALVEVHDDTELETALAAGATLVGVNQRDLRTFEVDTGLAAELAACIPDHVVAVAESGIRTVKDAERLASSGYQGLLIGETLVTSADPASAVRGLSGHRVGSRTTRIGVRGL